MFLKNLNVNDISIKNVFFFFEFNKKKILYYNNKISLIKQ